ncbi:MAG TPA: hypothetical protein VFM83_06230 [Gaiellaceae bacterium]|nr:hypothetical protein [Gaiellaceae bacterium]
MQKYVAQARDLLDLDAALTPLRTANSRQRLEELTRIDVGNLTIDGAWELANELKRELLLAGDASYVWAQLEYEAARDKKPNKWHRWSDYFASKKLRGLIAARTNGTVTESAHLDAVRSLMKLYELRAESGLERRVRAAQKFRYLTALIPMLFVGLMLLTAGIYESGREGIWKAIWVAASAGALGATLSGTFRVRDRLIELDDLRSFWPAMRVQPLIGATAGLVTLFVLETGAVELGAKQTASWAALALFTFVAGFSEPFFLGLVQRVAVIPDKQAGGMS